MMIVKSREPRTEVEQLRDENEMLRAQLENAQKCFDWSEAE